MLQMFRPPLQVLEAQPYRGSIAGRPGVLIGYYQAKTHTHGLSHMYFRMQKLMELALPTNFYGCCLQLASMWGQDMNPKTLEKISWLELVTKYYGYVAWTETWQNPGKIAVFRARRQSISISMHYILFNIIGNYMFWGCKSVANQFVCVFAGFIHLAWPSIGWYLDEQKSDNNLERSSFLASDSRLFGKNSEIYNFLGKSN